MKPRQERLQKLRSNPEVSVLIVGAGINGIGTFRDLAFQGIDVVLVDREDYCSGASAASSHMVHGGIRYLENGELSLVREAVHERNYLIENAPHLVKPLATTFPIFKWFSGLFNAPFKLLGLMDRPAERGAIVIKIGMLLYDFFTRKQKTVPKHVFKNRKESLALFPALNPEVIFTGTYYDGAMPSPERIAMELIEDAVSENDRAIPLNYVEMVSARGKSVTLRDESSGDSFEVNPRLLVNAAGPWIDLVNGSMGKQTNYIVGTKGSHLILDHPELREAIGDNEFFFENKDGRIVLIFPLYDKVMIGTSDIPVKDPNAATITEEEATYFIEMVKRVFPKIHVDRSDIIYTFSGVRPLKYTEGDTPGQFSRNHKVQVDEAGDLLDIPVFSLVGGKWTSFRAFSEVAANIILDRLGVERKLSTVKLQIGGSQGYPINEIEKEGYLKNLIENYPIERKRLEQLFEIYGTRAAELLQKYGSELSEMLETIPEISVGEIKSILLEEDVNHLDDLILRRTMLGKLGKITPDSLREISEICAKVMNWSSQKKEQEMDRFTDLLRHKHKMNFNAYIGR
ncbi:MAG: glycerol-3-phosphate dehydrogenase/oxidase [Anaerolineales bacterium]|jgi:glycerol-3-phosphate dehydrogenase